MEVDCYHSQKRNASMEGAARSEPYHLNFAVHHSLCEQCCLDLCSASLSPSE